MRRVRDLLRRKIKAFGGVEATADALGCSREFLYMLMSGSGDKRPGLDMAIAMEQLLEVPAEWWALPTKASKPDAA